MRIKNLILIFLTIGILFVSNDRFFPILSAENSIKMSVKPPKIIARKDWNAKEPVGQGKEHQISFITIHHTATLQKKDVSIEKKMQNLQSFSQREDKLASGKLKPVWFDIPYHYYIAVDGKIAEGREIKFAGDTNTEYDPTGHALVVLEGSFDTEKVTDEQQKSLQKIVAWLADEYKISADKIKGHNDYAKTGCPGKNLKDLFPMLRGMVGKIK
jgi:N-acetyl-anhydromuramyl-L-alanine amidase AmpD